jgi:hypothetical protein
MHSNVKNKYCNDMKEEIQKILYTELTIEESERLTEKLLNLFNVSKKICDCEKPKYILNEIKQELICKCGKRFNVC